MRRFDHEYVAARRLIGSGALGRVLLLHCIHRNMANGPQFDSAMMITDSVVHEVDVARFLLGVALEEEERLQRDLARLVPASTRCQGDAPV
jgi:myo-inositol 2-dehydrogenase/D-chiro-inositol 1-dehydrogenase